MPTLRVMRMCRPLLRSAPCYGNNDEYADSIGREIDRISVEYGGKYSMRDLGIHNDVRYVPFTSHVPFGKVVVPPPMAEQKASRFPMALPPLAWRGCERPNSRAAFQLQYQEHGHARPCCQNAEHQVHAQMPGRRCEGTEKAGFLYPHFLRPQALACAVQRAQQGKHCSRPRRIRKNIAT